MWKPLVLGIVLVLGIAQSFAQNGSDKIGRSDVEENKLPVLNELLNDYLECAAYFTVTAYCVGGYPAPTVPKLVRDNQHLAKTALDLAIANGAVMRLTNASAEAGSKTIATALMRAINNNCLNVRDLSARYDAFCERLMRGPNERVDDLLARRICTGHFKCELSRRSRE